MTAATMMNDLRTFDKISKTIPSFDTLPIHPLTERCQELTADGLAAVSCDYSSHVSAN
jgi:hypothetical protein